MPVQKLFPAQDKNERVLVVIRRHWFTYGLFWLIAIILALPLLVGFYLVSSSLGQLSENLVSILILVGSAYTLGILGLLLYGFIDFYLDIYIVTDRRIVDIKQNGFFNRSISELNLHQVQDVKAMVKGIFPTVIHYGDVYIQTAGKLENFIFKDIPHPYRVTKLILDLHQASLEDKDGVAKCMPIDFEEDEKEALSLQDFNEGSDLVKKKNIVQEDIEQELEKTPAQKVIALAKAAEKAESKNEVNKKVEPKINNTEDKKPSKKAETEDLGGVELKEGKAQKL